MSEGISVTMEQGSCGELALARLYAACCALLLYVALWGGLCSMAFLSTAGVVPLLPGGLLALLLPFVPGKQRVAAALATGLAVAAALLLTRSAASEGVRLLLNRFFAASETRQSYIYEKFAVSAAAGISEIRFALLTLGILAGLACGLGARFRWTALSALLFAGFCGFSAWLGISPIAGRLALLAIAAALPFLRPAGGGAAGVTPLVCGLLLTALVCGAVLLFLPGEDARLSAWDEAARDALAADTTAYADRRQYETLREERTRPETARQFYREETADAAPEGDDAALPLPFHVLLAILLTALLLFVPAILSDRLKKRRAANRAGLDAADCATGTRAAFLYAMRWLDAGGLCFDNRPYGDCAAEIETLCTPEIRAEFERVLPLWRQAAYSGRGLDEARRAEMLRFMEHTRAAVWDGLGKRRRFWVKYIDAL